MVSKRCANCDILIEILTQATCPSQAHYNLYALLSEVAKTRPEFEQESIDHLHKAAEAEILLAVYALATRYSEVSHLWISENTDRCLTE